MVVRTANGGGSRFGAQHSQSVENWCMMIPGLRVVAPSTPRDVVGLLVAAVRDPDPVVVDELGKARVVREGTDSTIFALALMVPRALEAADRLAADGISAEVVDIGSLVPLDTETILGSVEKTSRLFTVEENPSLCGWGAEITSIVSKGDVLVFGRPNRPHHHAAHPAPRGRCPRGDGHPVGRPHLRDSR
jgi:pyruvate dehydrogenase E1 component beta subunit